MTFDEATDAIAGAKQTMASADRMAQELGSLLRGRLRKVSGYVLEDLKKELRDFNAHTRNWKD